MAFRRPPQLQGPAAAHRQLGIAEEERAIAVADLRIARETIKTWESVENMAGLTWFNLV